MKVKEILEGDVIDFAAKQQQRADADVEAAKQGSRRYGDSGYTGLFQSLLARSQKNLSPVPALETEPLLDTTKKFTSAAAGRVYKMMLQVASPQEREIFQTIPAQLEIERQPPIALHARVNEKTNQPQITIALNVYSTHRKSRENDRLIHMAWANIAARLLAKTFGNVIVGLITPTITLNEPQIRFTLNTTISNPSLSGTVRKVFKDFNLGGIGIPWVDKVSTGYRLKIEGMELVDDRTFGHLVAAVKRIFGPLFIKMKHDNEISGIGHRPVGPGLTNYRIFLKPEVKQSYRLS